MKVGLKHRADGAQPAKYTIHEKESCNCRVSIKILHGDCTISNGRHAPIQRRICTTACGMAALIRRCTQNTLIICSEFSYLVILDTIFFYFISTIALSTKAFFVSSSQKSSNIPLPSPVFSNKSCPLYISISCENQQSCFTKHNS